MSEYTYEKDTDGIVTITFDAQDKSANTMTLAWLEGMEEMIERLKAEDGLTGVVLASAKKTYFAGGDLDFMLNSTQTAQETFDAARASAGASHGNWWPPHYRWLDAHWQPI